MGVRVPSSAQKKELTGVFESLRHRFFVFFVILHNYSNRINALSIYIFAGTIIGLRLGHCLFYEPAYYLSNPIEILKVWEGGLASHGAAFGILLAVWIYSRKYKFSYIGLLDKIVIVIPLAGALVRMGNLMNSEIFGDATNLPWGFIFVKAQQTIPRHPTQIYEAIACIIIFAILLYLYYKKNAGVKTGYLFGVFLILLFSFRFIVEFIKDVQVDFEKAMFLNMGQLLSIPLIGVGIFLLGRAMRKQKE